MSQNKSKANNSNSNNSNSTSSNNMGTEVIKRIVQRPISCWMPLRKRSAMRKRSSKTWISTSLKGPGFFNIEAHNINLMMHNNLESGKGLLSSIKSLFVELCNAQTSASRTAAKSNEIRVCRGVGSIYVPQKFHVRAKMSSSRFNITRRMSKSV